MHARTFPAITTLRPPCSHTTQLHGSSQNSNGVPEQGQFDCLQNLTRNRRLAAEQSMPKVHSNRIVSNPLLQQIPRIFGYIIQLDAATNRCAHSSSCLLCNSYLEMVSHSLTSKMGTTDSQKGLTFLLVLALTRVFVESGPCSFEALLVTTVSLVAPGTWARCQQWAEQRRIECLWMHLWATPCWLCKEMGQEWPANYRTEKQNCICIIPRYILRVTHKHPESTKPNTVLHVSEGQTV